MYIRLLVKLFGNVENLAFGAYKADRSGGRFLHNIAQRACQNYLSAALEHGRLDLKHFSAHRCPSKTVHDADLIFRGVIFRLIFIVSEKILYVRRFYRNALNSVTHDFCRRFSAERSNISLEISDPRLAGIVVDKAIYRVI